ncbi:hypothetical protein F7725_003650 [Dissostichus mawsoni]|uniref:Uncharacterized protein n=1 Tax=Dissostichus mawsoni TaxID=36200 RepID=A0A7J5YAS8_DISMA|nr:hypothetical protein F7725_003650 [Dissostichus mawsoni]
MGLLTFALAGAGAAGAVVAAPVVLAAIGFTSAGIAAGSIAAGMMSTAAVANGEQWQPELQWLFCRQQVQPVCQQLPLQVWLASEQPLDG